MEPAELSSELDRSPSPPRAPSPKKAKTKKGKGSKAVKESSAPDRDSQRRHNALEKQFSKAQRQAQQVQCPQMLEGEVDHQECSAAVGPQEEDLAEELQLEVPEQHRGLAQPSCNLEQCRSRSRSPSVVSHRSRTSRSAPEATFTPTAAGLREEAGPSMGPPVDFNLLFTQAISNIFQAGLHQTAGRPLLQGCASAVPSTMQYVPVHQPSTVYSATSDHVREDDMVDDFELSEDEEVVQEKPAFPGLFKPSMFKSLLRKAKIATNMDSSLNQASSSQSKGPTSNLFLVPEPDHDFVPCPDLFSQVIQKPWEHPASLSGPNSFDRKLYCSAPELDALLQLPSVDEPVASLTSSTILVGEAGDGLKFEDKRAEMAFRKSHQATAWAIRAATSSSFFNRASLVWLRQLRDRLPPEDARLQQDVAKLIAAAEYSADASLDAVKFSARALASTVSSRRLLWLRNWRADAKSKWRLTAAPYKGSALFGASLDSVLVENRDKKKVLPTLLRRQERRYSPYPRPSFRQDQSSTYQRSSQFSYQPASDRSSFRDRGRRSSSFRRPFRAPASRYPRRGK